MNYERPKSQNRGGAMGEETEAVRILVVDDNPDHAELARRALKVRSSYAVDTAETLDEALALCKVEPYHAILTDFRLPDGDGLTLIDWAKKDSLVIMMTGQGDERTAVEAMQKGAYDYIVKDALFRDLIPDVMERALERRRHELELLELRETLKRENLKLVEANKRLKSLDALKNEFLSAASGELQAPLVIIRDFVALMKDELAGTTTETQNVYLDSALSNCDRLSSLIDDVLNLQGIESGAMRLRRRRVDPFELVDHCLERVRSRIDQKGIRLDIDIADGLPPALGDEEKLSLALGGLVDNAVRFAPAEGRVTVSGRAGHDGRVILEVQDDGPGIDAGDHERIFGRFTQSTQVLTAGPAGAGLGLSLVKTIVELHEGEISLKSKLGEGASFAIDLPAYSGRSELRAFLHDRMARLAAASGSLSLSLLRPVDLESREIGQSAVDTLKTVEETARRAFRHDDDETLLIESEAILAILLEADQGGGQAVLRRLLKSVSRETGQVIPMECVSLSVGSGIEAEDWLEMALRRMIRTDPRVFYRRILVVDDSEEMLEAVSDALVAAPFDWQVDAVSNGVDACAAIKSDEPDLVVLDAVMPDMSGEEVLRRMKGMARSGGARVLALSGYPDKAERLVALGADDMIVKPLKPSALVAKVNELLSEATFHADETDSELSLSSPLLIP